MSATLPSSAPAFAPPGLNPVRWVRQMTQRLLVSLSASMPCAVTAPVSDSVREAVVDFMQRTGIEGVPEEELAMVAADIRHQLATLDFSIGECLQTNAILGRYFDEALLGKHAELIECNRTMAVSRMDAYAPYSELTDGWTENPHALTDAEMAAFFRCEQVDNRFLTTYFDSAQSGLRSQPLIQEIERFAQRNSRFDDFVKFCKLLVTKYFRFGRDFSMENLFFTKNGTNAFRLFCNTFLKAGDIVLVSSEEYAEIINMMKAQGVRVVTLPPFADEASYGRAIFEATLAGDIDYILVSSVTRRGTVLPLMLFADARDRCREEGKKTSLIVDACQAFGRVRSDFERIRPDVCIASCQKGSDFGGPAGLLALSDTFTLRDSVDAYRLVLEDKRIELANKEALLGAALSGANANDHEVKQASAQLKLDIGRLQSEIAKLERAQVLQLQPYEAGLQAEEMGTLNKMDMARFAFGGNPDLLGRMVDADKKPLPPALTMPLAERQAANHQLAYRFAWLIQKINQTIGHRIEILHPSGVYREDGSVDPRRIGFLFECRVRGVTRAQVQQIAGRYGVTIRDYFDEADPENAFRIAFHPFMGNDALKILGYVLEEAAKAADAV